MFTPKVIVYIASSLCIKSFLFLRFFFGNKDYLDITLLMNYFY